MTDKTLRQVGLKAAEAVERHNVRMEKSVAQEARSEEMLKSEALSSVKIEHPKEDVYGHSF